MRALVIVNGWNCEEYVEACIKSILDQDYKEFSLIIIDDGSTDKTTMLILKMGIARFVDYRHCPLEKSVGTAAARAFGQAVADGEGMEYEVVIWVDMDDLLLPGAITRVMKEYEDPDCWLTYGGCVSMSSNRSTLPDEALHFKSDWYRKEDWRYVHLRTHRRDLLYHLTDEDITGGSYQAYPDINMLFCMLELAGPDHIRVISEPLYHYRDSHPNTCINRFSWNERTIEKRRAMQTTPKNPLIKL